MFIYALQYSTTAYTGLMPVVAILMNQPVFHKISGCHWHAIGYGGHRPPQAPEAVETVDAEQDSQGNSNSGRGGNTLVRITT